jgi:hypothetical protein
MGMPIVVDCPRTTTDASDLYSLRPGHPRQPGGPVNGRTSLVEIANPAWQISGSDAYSMIATTA